MLRAKWIIISILAFSSHALLAKSIGYSVLSYNIRYDNSYNSLDNWQFRKDELLQRVLKVHPAIIGLQEALAHQAHYLGNGWKEYAMYGVGREDGKLRGEMIPIFYDTSMFTCLDSQTRWLSETPSVPSKGWDAACERVVASLVLQDKHTLDTVFVFNTHWDHEGQKARQQSAELICEMLRPLVARQAKVILMGDLNAISEDAAIRKISSVLLNTCPKKKAKAETFNGFGKLSQPGGHIDYVFVSPIPRSRVRYSIRHWLTNSNRWLSDHHAITVSVRWIG